jgi:hypothetical protein
MAPNIPTQLDEIRIERRIARHRAIGYLAALIAVTLVAAAHLVRQQGALVAALAALAASAWWLGIERRATWRRRELLDDLILHGWRNVARIDVEQREGELTARRNRRIVARALENQVSGSQPVGVMSPRRHQVTVELRRQRTRIRELARRVRSEDEPVSPVALVLLSQLLSDGDSPLLFGPADRIAPALERVEHVLDRAA